jgi:hypothetical protein
MKIQMVTNMISSMLIILLTASTAGLSSVMISGTIIPKLRIDKERDTGNHQLPILLLSSI